MAEAEVSSFVGKSTIKEPEFVMIMKMSREVYEDDGGNNIQRNKYDK